MTEIKIIDDNNSFRDFLDEICDTPKLAYDYVKAAIKWQIDHRDYWIKMANEEDPNWQTPEKAKDNYRYAQVITHIQHGIDHCEEIKRRMEREIELARSNSPGAVRTRSAS